MLILITKQTMEIAIASPMTSLSAATGGTVGAGILMYSRFEIDN